MGGAVAGAIFGDVFTGLAADIVGGAIIGGGVSLVTGGDPLQGALLGGIGGGIGGAISGAAGVSSAELSALDQAAQMANYMAGEGFTASEISQNLINAGITEGAAQSAAQAAILGGGADLAGVNTALGLGAQGGSFVGGALGNTAGSYLSAGGYGLPNTLASGAGKAAGAAATNSIGGAIGNVISAGMTANAAQAAAKTNADAATRAGQEQLAIFNQQTQLQAPWLQAGQEALTRLTAGTQPGGEFTKSYSLADFESGPQSGLYNFTKAQANEAMQNQLNMGGQQMSSNAVVGAGKLASNLADQYYNTGFNQNMAEKQVKLNSLQSLANQGQTSVNQSNANLGNLGTSLGNTTMTAGNANAAGIVGANNAWSGAISNIGNNMLAMNTLASLFS